MNETIAAIATPPGTGGIAVIRISGSKAIEIANKLFSKDVFALKTHTLTFGKVLDQFRAQIDEVLLAIMKAPRSFTGEDVIEIHCHGGALISQKVLSRCLECGAKAAGPGQFSQRAFLNGKLDLSQAEAIQQLIHAKSEKATQAAANQLKGSLSSHIKQFQHSLTQIAAIIEAWVDYPEEGLEFASKEEIISELQTIYSSLFKLQSTFHEGKIISQGVNLCILGAPNVGKSSLLNALLGFDRAIVTDIAGTTRDLLQEEITLGGIHFNLIDTAGIRQTDEIIEKMGIERSKQAQKEADLILLVLDSTQTISNDEIKLIDSLPKSKTILVWNKIDHPHSTPSPYENSTPISAKNNTEIVTLQNDILQLVFNGNAPDKSQVTITQERHYQELTRALESLKNVIEGLESDLSAEFISFDLRDGLKALGQIIGTNVTEDILGAIFSKFCVGK
ncbi:MAG: tRNA uridine-5-carboxymethylaminomethyl(34) synthesis GTPase MnmE [Rhabdochlamydiaceae bacterium]|nr:tRNA uridine-5-carboxymethylaminomethyl(34) synthesis GTPase MnmE [Candidatus Amphrikana amoebophyrae]